MKSLVFISPSNIKSLVKAPTINCSFTFTNQHKTIVTNFVLPTTLVQNYTKPRERLDNYKKRGENPTKIWERRVRESWKKPLTQSQLDMLPPKKSELRYKNITDKAPLRAMKPQRSQPLRQPLIQDTSVPVFNFLKEEVGQVTLPKEIFLAPVRNDILHRCVVWQLSYRRAGTACAKTRSEVRGGGRKPRPQKGQGGARMGSIRAPNVKGGGVAFPPKPRSWAYPLPRKVLSFGLKSALSAKLLENKLFVLDSAALESHKTGSLRVLLEKNEWDNVLIVDGEKVNDNLRLASSNLPHVDVVASNEINVYSILLRDKLLLSKDSIEWLQNSYFKEELDDKKKLLTMP